MSTKDLSIGKSIMSVLSTNFIIAVVGVLSIFLFPKILSIESYALYHTFLLYINYITILHLGFSTGMVINYAGVSYKDIDVEQYKSEMAILFLILITFTVGFIALYILTDEFLIGCISLAIIPFVLTGSYKNFLLAWGNFKLFSLISISESILIPATAIWIYFYQGAIDGRVYISIYLSIYWIIALGISFQIWKKVSSVQAKKLFSRKNFETEKIGLVFVLGNYLNVLFIAVDKQFIQCFFSSAEFAFYSFAISMQSLMTILITSISQPLYPAMAKRNFGVEDYIRIKEVLLLIGALSGCAYFFVSIIVNSYIPNYIPSLDLVGIYFLMFPAVAVINCIYLNYYKVYKKTKVYIKSLFIVFIFSVILNAIMLYCFYDYKYIAMATVFVYYLWLIFGVRSISIITIEKKDILFLILFLFSFLLVKNNFSSFLGLIVYSSIFGILAVLFFKKTLFYFLRNLRYKYAG